jgi:hypothetical protein
MWWPRSRHQRRGFSLPLDEPLAWCVSPPLTHSGANPRSGKWPKVNDANPQQCSGANNLITALLIPQIYSRLACSSTTSIIDASTMTPSPKPHSQTRFKGKMRRMEANQVFLAKHNPVEVQRARLMEGKIDQFSHFEVVYAYKTP